MGLALHNPSSSLSDLTELRHHISRERNYNLLHRHGWYGAYLEHGGDYPGHLPPRLRPHQLAVLSSARRSPRPCYVDRLSDAKAAHRTRRQWAAEDEEGRDLARSG